MSLKSVLIPNGNTYMTLIIYKCDRCGKHISEDVPQLNAHHIKSFKEYPELRLDINNGITLCIACQRKERHHGKTQDD